MLLPFSSPLTPFLLLSMPVDCIAEGNLRIRWQPQRLLCCLEQFCSGSNLQSSLSRTKALQITRSSPPTPFRRQCRDHPLLPELAPPGFTPHPTQLTTEASTCTENPLQRNVQPDALSDFWCPSHTGALHMESSAKNFTYIIQFHAEPQSPSVHMFTFDSLGRD